MKKILLDLLCLIAYNSTSQAYNTINSVSINGSIWKGQLSNENQQYIRNQINGNNVRASLYDSSGKNAIPYLYAGKYFSKPNTTGKEYLIHFGLKKLSDGNNTQPDGYKESGSYFKIQQNSNNVSSGSFENGFMNGTDAYFKVYIK